MVEIEGKLQQRVTQERVHMIRRRTRSQNLGIRAKASVWLSPERLF